MTTLVSGLNFNGKTIHPITTYAMSGLGNTERDYAASCPGAKLGKFSPSAARRSPTPSRPAKPGCAASACLLADQEPGRAAALLSVT
ncbi:NADPH-dependent FMN reductase family protein [Paractinoplanes durhamensis]|uniref:hypothetical protein n=1 Tax=Paractinoplanes durhamensis TaxID=113563 RepID=UPI00364168EF